MTSLSDEEWRSQFIAENIAVLKWWEVAAAALYDLGGSSKVTALSEHPFVQALVTANGRSRNVHQTLWQILNSHTVEESVTVKLKKRFSQESLTNRPILFGISPVTGAMSVRI